MKEEAGAEREEKRRRQEKRSLEKAHFGHGSKRISTIWDGQKKRAYQLYLPTPCVRLPSPQMETSRELLATSATISCWSKLRAMVCRTVRTTSQTFYDAAAEYLVPHHRQPIIHMHQQSVKVPQKCCTAKSSPKMPQVGAKMPQNGAQRPQDGPKSEPRCSNLAPKCPKMAPSWN